MTGATVRASTRATAERTTGVEAPHVTDNKAKPVTKAARNKPIKCLREALALTESNFRDRTDVQNASPAKIASPRYKALSAPPKATYREHKCKQENPKEIAPLGEKPASHMGASRKRQPAADASCGEGAPRQKKQKHSGSSDRHHKAAAQSAEAGPSAGHNETSAGKDLKPVTDDARAMVPCDKRTSDVSKAESNGPAPLGTKLEGRRKGGVDSTAQPPASDVAAAAPAAGGVVHTSQEGTGGGSQRQALQPTSKQTALASLANPVQPESDGPSLKDAQSIGGHEPPPVASEAPPVGQTTQTGHTSRDRQGPEGPPRESVRLAVTEAGALKPSVLTSGEGSGSQPAGTCAGGSKPPGNLVIAAQRPKGKQRVAHGKRSTVHDAAGGAGAAPKQSKAGTGAVQHAGAACPEEAPKHEGPSGVAAAAVRTDVVVGVQPDSEQAVALPVIAPAPPMLPPPPVVASPLVIPVFNLPCLDNIGECEQEGIIALQRELADLRARYKQLTGVKLREMEGILAEQIEYAEQKVRCAEEKVHAYQADSEAAERRAVEAVRRMIEIEAEKTAWLKERFEHLRDRIRLEQELGQVQRDNHDLRAENLRLRQVASTAVAVDNGVRPAVLEGSNSEVLIAAVAAANRQEDAMDTELSPNRMLIAGGPDERSPAPGGNEKQGFVGNGDADTSPALASTKTGVSTACLKVVRMLPSLGNHDEDVVPHPTAVATAQLNWSGDCGGVAPERFQLGADSQVDPDAALCDPTASGDRLGVSKECLLVVQMLPSLRVPVSSGGVVQGPEPADTAATPHAEAPVQVPSASLTLSGKHRRSDGSPIDGICGSDQRRAGANNTGASFTFAPVIGTLGNGNVHAQEPRPQGFNRESGGSARKAVVPPGDVPLLDLGIQAPPDAPSKTPLSARARAVLNAAALVNNSESASSKQASCNVPLLLCRAHHQQQQQQQDAGIHGRLSPQPRGAAAVTPAPPAARSPLARSPLVVTPVVEAGAAAAQEHPAGVAGTHHDPAPQRAVPSSPSPTTARLLLYEKLSGWQVHLISVKPSHSRYTHIQYGMSYELEEGQLSEDDEVDVAEGSPGEKKYIFYTPLELGSLKPHLPSYFEEPMEFEEDCLSEFMDKINQAIAKAQHSRLSGGQ